ncbi:flavin-containing monooxygenase [Amycolatopsis sp. VS8301801F10]|uniref:flavin-containing monooxygenase n=1 Tax=Amycolatopsis sp. VS8301801F10 TaxID=2652442 RepID=UPI0038FC1AFD
MSLLRPRASVPETTSTRELDALIVGAGFSGMYLLHRLRGLGLAARVYERGEDVGGTWYWNRYPGARCDIESVDYSYSFSPELEQEWEWSERYAAQPEILRYAGHVADRFDLRRDIQFGAQVLSAEFDEAAGRWHVRTDLGELIVARYVVLATGCLSAGNVPDLPGRDAFRGETYHTGDWPHDGVDFAGKRVGVLGTGSSAIQSIPLIAEQAAHTVVFQRTPNFSLPAHNRPLTPEFRAEVKRDYPRRREIARYNSGGVTRADPEIGALEVTDEERREIYERQWRAGGLNFASLFNDLRTDRAANETAAEFIRGKIREIVEDARTAELLSPKDYPFGAKRPCVDTGYYATFNREDVQLVDLRTEPIAEITPHGVRTAAAEYEVDCLVYATGFDAMTGAVNAIDIRGRGGESLREAWAAGPRTYLGVGCAGFPNLFLIATVGSPSVLSNMMTSIEQHVDWVADCIGRLRAEGFDTIEATEEAQNEWVAHVNELAAGTLFLDAASWYLGANIPGKPRVFMPYVGGVGVYRELCDRIAAEGYRGFRRTVSAVAA